VHLARLNGIRRGEPAAVEQSLDSAQKRRTRPPLASLKPRNVLRLKK